MFNPGITRLMREAEEVGARKIISGTKMVVVQAVDTFKRVTGVEPPYDVMYSTAMKMLFPDSYQKLLDDKNRRRPAK